MSSNWASVTFVIGVALNAGSVHAEQTVALIANNTLLIFDTASPATTTARAVTGLGANETIHGIDYRPATGELLAGTVTTGSAANSLIWTYRIDAATGAATLVGVTASVLALAADIPTGYDVNPVVDRIRYVNLFDENARLNPNNGGLAGNDADLSPAATILAAAYDRNAPGSPLTTLYLINRSGAMLAIQGGIDGTPSPNGGVVTDLCPLGIGLHASNDAGFDISPSGVGYAAITNSATGLTGLYRLTLPTAVSATPCATFVGLISTGLIQVFSLTILPPDTDGDGVRDPLDGCPIDAAKTAPGVCGCGAADVDTDADGTHDCNDGCPNDAAKTAAGACGCGMADTDADGNGTADCLDPAPMMPGAGCGVCGPSFSGIALSALGVYALATRRRGR